LSKIAKQPFKLESRPTSKVFKLLHLDLIGPISPESKIKSNYILTVVDNFLVYLTGFPLARKDDTAEVLIQLINNQQKKLGYFPSLICSDGGGEFTGNRLVSYLDDKRIQRLTSEPYHPEHNGRAERANRTILESMQATFRSSCVPKNYWHEVVKSCCFALNQIPQNGELRSPWEVLHGYSIPSNYLKPIGTPAVVLKMKQVKGCNFNEKGEEGTLVGFNVLLRSYQILAKSGTILDSKHV
jgi:hypothetical protein